MDWSCHVSGSSLLSQLLTVRHTDSDVQRRGRNLIILTIGVIVMVMLSIPLTLIQPEPLPQLIPAVIGGLLCIPLIFVVRSGRVTLAAGCLIVLLTGALFLIPLGSRQIGLTPGFYIAGVLVASVAGSPWLVAATTVVSVIGIGAQSVLLAGDPQHAPAAIEVSAVGAILTVVSGLIGGLGSHSTTQSLNIARLARERAEAAAAALDRLNHDLEQRVADRTAALSNALAESEQRAEEQARLLTENRKQRDDIRAMSVPVLPVSDTTLVMPLIGSLDDERIATVRERALIAIEQSQARRFLIDITGVPMLDDQVAGGLLSVIQAARLLGAEAILIGVTPEVAQSLVSLGIDLQDLHTRRDLREALA